GVAPNDGRDRATGPNGLQNYAVRSSVSLSDGGTPIRGALDSTPGYRYRIAFFSSPAADPSGYGEGASFLGAIQVAVGGRGRATFTAATLPPVPLGAVLTATATRISGSRQYTSEFSPALAVSAADVSPAPAPDAIVIT